MLTIAVETGWPPDRPSTTAMLGSSIVASLINRRAISPGIPKARDTRSQWASMSAESCTALISRSAGGGGNVVGISGKPIAGGAPCVLQAGAPPGLQHAGLCSFADPQQPGNTPRSHEPDGPIDDRRRILDAPGDEGAVEERHGDPGGRELKRTRLL